MNKLVNQCASLEQAKQKSNHNCLIIVGFTVEYSIFWWINALTYNIKKYIVYSNYLFERQSTCSIED